ncbi:MAG: CHAT domain-containing protein [Elusimicrobia bacterium]|nr:CHAT domain-containing protein [Elusimicrobiota bacterium]
MSPVLALLLALPAAAADRTEALKIAGARVLPNDYRGAVALLEPALRDARREKNWQDARVLSKRLGDVYWLPLSDFPRAYESYLITREADRALGDRKAEAEILDSLAKLTAVFGDFAKAAALYEDAAALAGAAGDAAARERHLKSSAHFQGILNSLDEGTTLKRDAPPLPGPSATPAERRAAADGLLAAGRTKDARAIYESLDDLAGVGSCLMADKDYAGADARYAAHNARYEAMKPGPGWRPLIDYGRGEALERQGKLREAAAFYRLAWERAQKKHARWKLDSNDSYFIFGVDPAEALTRVAEPEEAFYYADLGRARVLAKTLGARRGTRLAPLPPALARRETSLQRRLDEARRRREAAFDRRDRGEVERVDREIEEGPGREIEELAVEIRRVRPDYAAARYPRPLHAADIPLEKDEVLLEYEVTESSARVFVVRGGKVAAVRAIPATRGELTRLVRAYRSFFDGVAGTEDLARFDATVGKTLGDLLLRPVLGDLPKDAKLIVVPDEVLSVLPFEALVLEAPERPLMPAGRRGPAPAGVRYAGDEYDIAYAPSAAALAFRRALKTPQRASNALFVLADPIFDPSDPRARGVAVRSEMRREVADAVFRSMGAGGKRRGAAEKAASAETAVFPRLDKTALLSDALERRIFAGKGTLAFLGADATEAAVKSEDLSRYRYLVFATHGILDGSAPYLREPALVLGQTGGGAEDGFLTMGEVAKLKLNADLVALTACQTGLGRAIRGEGNLGLVRAFQQAGADSVLVSLWSVSEDSTTELARDFFARLERGLTPRAALREARAELRRQGYEHPFYWAPFVLVGD